MKPLRSTVICNCICRTARPGFVVPNLSIPERDGRPPPAACVYVRITGSPLAPVWYAHHELTSCLRVCVLRQSVCACVCVCRRRR